MNQFRIFALFLCLWGNCLVAHVSDHLKKIGEVHAKRHSMRNIDFIYTINLDQRPEKFAHCIKELKPYGITPYRFSAVNGWELSLEAINDVGVKYDPPSMRGNEWATSYLLADHFQPHDELVQVAGRTYFCHAMARGTIGIVLSHLSVLQDAWDKGYPTIWVMEDDIQVIRNPKILSKLIDNLDERVGKKGWDVLFTDFDIKDGEGNYVPCRGHAWRPNFVPSHPQNYHVNQLISPQFRQIGARFGAHSMIIRRSGIEKILNFIKQYDVYLPYDMDFYLPENIRLYTVMKDVVSNLPKALSDNGAPGYKK